MTSVRKYSEASHGFVLPVETPCG
ncbi:hypothetical protein [Caballeronia sp. 15711]